VVDSEVRLAYHDRILQTLPEPMQGKEAEVIGEDPQPNWPYERDGELDFSRGCNVVADSRSPSTSRSYRSAGPTAQKGYQPRSTILPPHSTKYYIRPRRASTLEYPGDGNRNHPSTRFPIILPFLKRNRTIPRSTPLLDSRPSLSSTPLIGCIILLEIVTANAAYHD